MHIIETEQQAQAELTSLFLRMNSYFIDDHVS
jgi:hypothetical protein